MKKRMIKRRRKRRRRKERTNIIKNKSLIWYWAMSMYWQLRQVLRVVERNVAKRILQEAAAAVAPLNVSHHVSIKVYDLEKRHISNHVVSYPMGRD